MVVVAGYSARSRCTCCAALTPSFWVPVAILAVIFLAAHIAVRLLAPYADPVLLPVVALINGVGVAFLRRLNLGQADAAERSEIGPLRRHRRSAAHLDAAGGAGAIGLLAIVRDHRVVSRYAWTLGLVGLVLMSIPRPAAGSVLRR